MWHTYVYHILKQISSAVIQLDLALDMLWANSKEMCVTEMCKITGPEYQINNITRGGSFSGFLQTSAKICHFVDH